MRAALLTSYGPPDLLTVGETPKPLNGNGEVLVRVHASSVNPIDYRIRSGGLKLFTGKRPPLVLGQDFAGTVAEVGAGVQGLKVGDRVHGMTPPLKGGCYAEYVKVQPKCLTIMPAGLSFNEAAALPLAALTAYQGLLRCAHLKPRDRLLVNGASGGVGAAAVQIGKALGCHVTAVCSGRNKAFVQALGADEVIDYSHESVTSRLDAFDVFFDCAGNLSWAEARPTLVAGGRFVTTEPIIPLMLLGPLLNPLRSRKTFVVAVSPNSEDLKALDQWIEQGRFKVTIDRCFPLQQVAQAHTLSETRRVVGKLVINIDADPAQPA